MTSKEERGATFAPLSLFFTDGYLLINKLCLKNQITIA